MRIILVIGTRPQIIKSAPLISLMSKDPEIELFVIHTGQHYDYEMSKIFFDEFNLPDADLNLLVGSGNHAWQTGEMIIRLDKPLHEMKPDIVIVPGDTNSTLSAALVASKLNIPIAHVEAGARSYDMTMPEEINRRLTDHCSKLLFTPTKNCSYNILKEGIPEKNIYLTGDTMYDSLLQHLNKAYENNILKRLNIKPGDYGVLTVHRPKNVDNLDILRELINELIIFKELTIIFIVHPRTEKNLRKASLIKILEKTDHIKMIKPINYNETIKLISQAKVLLTDSGGMQKEAFWLKTHCITLRERTEWIETVNFGVNILSPIKKGLYIDSIKRIIHPDFTIEWDKFSNPFGDGKAAIKIINIIKEYLR